MYEVVKAYIQAGGYDLSALLTKIDTLWVQGSLTDDQRTQLQALARDGATVAGSVDVLAMLLDHDARIKALEKTGSAESEKLTEYVAGMVALNDERYLWEGEVYTCIAPEGVKCVWTPEGYPTYWRKEVA